MRSVVLEGPARRMSAFDAGFLYLERPHSPLSIGCVAVLDGAVSREELIGHLATHLGEIPRYSERVVPAPFSLTHPAWRPDPDFDLRNHVHRQGVPRPGGPAELCEAVAELFARPLDRSRPLWDAHLLDGLSEGRTALVERVHHCMLDGVAGAGILEALLDADSTADTPCGARATPSPAVPRRPLLPIELGRSLLDSTAAALERSRQIFDVLQHPAQLKQGLAPAREVARWAFGHVLNGPSALPWSGPIGPRRRVAFARFSLDDARAIRAAHGATINDVVLCVLAGGLRHYLVSVGIDPKRLPVVAVVPVSVRTPNQASALGNHLGVLLVPLILEPSEETERLERTVAITRRLKHERGHTAVAALLAAADLLPPSLVAWLGSRAHIPAVAGVVATNVRGPTRPRYLAGRRVESVYPIVPITDGLGLGMAVLSYAGTLHLGLNADADRLPDLEKLQVGIEQSMARLRAAV